MSPSAPHTGSKTVEEQLQSELQEARSTSSWSITKLKHNITSTLTNRAKVILLEYVVIIAMKLCKI